MGLISDDVTINLYKFGLSLGDFEKGYRHAVGHVERSKKYSNARKDLSRPEARQNYGKWIEHSINARDGLDEMRDSYNYLIKEGLPKHYHLALKSMRETIINVEQLLEESGIDVDLIWPAVRDADRQIEDSF